MQTITTLTAAGDTDPGLKREVNEDRFHIDVARGLFVLVDGVGGQNAGGKAADVALTMLRARLERETGPTADRIREEGWRHEFLTRSAARTNVGMRERSERLQPLIIETRRRPDQLMQILETLARVELTDGLTFPQLVVEIEITAQYR